MRIGFLVFISLFLMADLLCWVISARWLGKQQAARWVRWVCHGFFLLQTSYVLLLIGSMLIGGMHARRGPDWLPTPVLALMYVWHIVGLPVLCVAIMVAGISAPGRCAGAVGLAEVLAAGGYGTCSTRCTGGCRRFAPEFPGRVAGDGSADAGGWRHVVCAAGERAVSHSAVAAAGGGVAQGAGGVSHRAGFGSACGHMEHSEAVS